MSNTNPVYTVREAWLQAFIKGATPHIDAAAETAGVSACVADTRIRTSVGFPSSGQRGKAIGECFHASSSSDNAREIFITPTLQSNTEEVAGVLTHEVIHAILPDGAGHGKHFGRIARALGLEGKLTATVVGDKWREWAQPVLDELGPFPSASLRGLPEGKTRQKNRHLLAHCPACDFKARASTKHIVHLVGLECPACGEAELTNEQAGE